MKLNLGCGTQPIDGYENLDAKNCRPIYPLTEFADESVDEVRASHVLEHFGHGEINSVLKEWTRVLKPGGKLRIAVPDFEKVASVYADGNPSRLPIQGFVMGGQTDEYDFHKSLFDHESLEALLLGAGLGRIGTWTSEIDDCASYPISLNLEGVKIPQTQKLKIECAMSVPRLGFMDAFFVWAESLLPLGIRPSRYSGAFWGQCLERVMTDMSERADYILTVDYDSLFRRDDVDELIRLAVEYPEADAISSMQMSRQSHLPLMTIKDQSGKVTGVIPRETFRQPLVPAATAHFGLTLIRVESLKRMPHPWFLGVPDENGTWGEKKVDDDTHFWLKWGEIGNTLYVAPRVVIGHLELMATWPDQNCKPIFQHPSDYQKNGPPSGVWCP